MNIIHMDVESTKSAVDRIVGTIDGLDNVQQRLEGAANAIESGWSSDKAEGYRSRIRAAGKAITAAVNGLAALGMQMQNEITQWLEADTGRAAQLSQQMKSIFFLAGCGPTAPTLIPSVFDLHKARVKVVTSELQALLKTKTGKELDALAKKAGICIKIGNACLGDPNGRVIPIDLEDLPTQGGSHEYKTEYQPFDEVIRKSSITLDRIVIDTDTLPDVSSVDPNIRGILAHEISHAIDLNSNKLKDHLIDPQLLLTDETYLERLARAADSKLESEIRAYEYSAALGDKRSGITADGKITISEKTAVLEDMGYGESYTEYVNSALQEPWGVNIWIDPNTGKACASLNYYIEIQRPK